MTALRAIASIALLALAVAVEIAAQAILSVAKDLHRLSLWLLSGALRLVKPVDVKETP